MNLQGQVVHLALKMILWNIHNYYQLTDCNIPDDFKHTHCTEKVMQVAALPSPSICPHVTIQEVPKEFL